LAVVVVVVAVAASFGHDGERTAAVAPERAALAFTRYAGAENPSVWLAEADGSHLRRVVRGAYGAKLSSDGERLAYLIPARDPTSLPTLFVRPIAGGRPHRVATAFGYRWSPNGARLAAQGPRALVLFDARSGEKHTLVRGRVIAGFSFSPAGDAIAYGRWNGGAGRNYRSDVFVINLRTRRVARLTDNRHSDNPVWGRNWIVYRRFHFSGDWSIGRLHLLRPNGRDDRLLARGDERTPLARMGLDPLELSANGTVLLACAAAEFNCAPVMFLVPRGLGASFAATIRRLARAGEVANAADLSRDGRRVLFTLGPFDSPTGDRVYEARFDGGEPRLLVRNATEPSWAP
jgi:Tol biopolymer transport system component